MRRALACSLVAAAIAVAPLTPVRAASHAEAATSADATPGPGPAEDERVLALRKQHADAQAFLLSYRSTRNLAELQAARELLARWLVGHEALFGSDARAQEVRIPVQQQLAAIDRELAMAITRPAPPMPMSDLRDIAEKQKSRKMILGGSALISLGLASVFLVGVPLWSLRDRALERADTERYYVEEQKFIRRARRRQVGAVVMFAVGGTLAAAGLPYVVIGVSKRARMRRELSLRPAVGPGYAGLGATLRF